MEVKPLPPVPGLPEPRLIRLDDEVESHAIHLALVDIREILLPDDQPLWSYLGSLAGGEFPQFFVATPEQLSRVLTGLNELLEATQRLGRLDTEIDLLTMIEIIRPYCSPEPPADHTT